MKLQAALNNMNKCFVAPDSLDLKKIDRLTALVSMTIIDQAVKDKVITEEEVLKEIKGEK